MEWSPKVLRHTAEVVQRLREEQDLSPEKLAKKAGISKNTIYNVEKGKAVGLDKLDAIFHALGLENGPNSSASTCGRRGAGVASPTPAPSPRVLQRSAPVGCCRSPIELGDRKALLVINLLDLTPGDEQPELPY